MTLRFAVISQLKKIRLTSSSARPEKGRSRRRLGALAVGLLAVTCNPGQAQEEGELAQGQVQTKYGFLQGVVDSGIVVFRGVPFAKPPVGDLRWREPQPPESWTGVRPAENFGPRCMQRPIFGDMNFRSNGMSEDCLYLNIWTPAKAGREKLPVLVYFYGGGFAAGDGSEPRYDGEAMARKGIVAVTVNYRLTVFGFLAHPELTVESPHKASGNYGLQDQAAALKWLKENIAAFGGDPDRMIIAGESAGSASVSAQMVSPLSKDLIAGAILSSGALGGGPWASPLGEAEQRGVQFGEQVGKKTLAELRAMPAEELLEATAKSQMLFFGPIVDGYFLAEDPLKTMQAGNQARVPLLGGWNSEEMNYRMILGDAEPTVENFKAALQRLYGKNAEEVFRVFSAGNEEEVIEAATDLASARFIALGTWKWLEVHAETSGQPVFRYLYARPRPPMRPEMGDAVPGLAGGVVRGEQARAAQLPPARGAVHSADIEYAMGNLPTNRVYDWQPEDYKVSTIFQRFYENFTKTSDPSGLGVPEWPAINGRQPRPVMIIDVNTRVEPEKHPERYPLLDRLPPDVGRRR